MVSFQAAPAKYPTVRKGTRLVAEMDPEVQALWDQYMASDGDQAKRLMESIIAAGKRQRGET